MATFLLLVWLPKYVSSKIFPKEPPKAGFG